MKNLVKAFGAVLSVATVLVSGPALASTGNDGSNGVIAKRTGNNAFAYTDAWGPVTCNETRHAKFETVSCTLTTPNLALAGTTGTVGWNSDFGAGLGTFTYTFSADGATYSGLATY